MSLKVLAHMQKEPKCDILIFFVISIDTTNMSCPAKDTSWHVRPSKTQIRLRRSQMRSLVRVFDGRLCVVKGPAFLQCK